MEFLPPSSLFSSRAETPMTGIVVVEETEMEEAEASPATKLHVNVVAMIVVEIVMETEIAVVTATGIVAVIGMVTEIGIEVDTQAPGTESKSHQRSVQGWLWLQGANPRRRRGKKDQLHLQVSLEGRSLLTQCRRKRRWTRNLLGRRKKRRKQGRKQERLPNPIPLVQPNQSTP